MLRLFDKEINKYHKNSKFEGPKQILEYLNRLTEDQEECFIFLNKRVELKGQIGFLNLLRSTQKEVKDTFKTFDPYWFSDILNFILNSVPEKTGYAGMVVFEGKNTDGEDCFFIKLRRAVKFSGIDLRSLEVLLKKLFGDLYMGGGGHAGAVSFRIHTMDEKEFLIRTEKIFAYFNQSLMPLSEN